MTNEMKPMTLRDALRDSPCPRPANGQPEDQNVGDCVDKGLCGCQNGEALRTASAEPVAWLLKSHTGFHDIGLTWNKARADAWLAQGSMVVPLSPAQPWEIDDQVTIMQPEKPAPAQPTREETGSCTGLCKDGSGEGCNCGPGVLASREQPTREETIEECAKIALGTAPVARGNFFEARRKQCRIISDAILALRNEAR